MDMQLMMTHFPQIGKSFLKMPMMALMRLIRYISSRNIFVVEGESYCCQIKLFSGVLLNTFCKVKIENYCFVFPLGIIKLTSTKQGLIFLESYTSALSGFFFKK